MGAAAYKLKLPVHWKIHPRFNEKLLIPYTPPAFPNQEVPPAPPPELINDEEEFEIEEILDSKTPIAPRRTRTETIRRNRLLRQMEGMDPRTQLMGPRLGNGQHPRSHRRVRKLKR